MAAPAEPGSVSGEGSAGTTPPTVVVGVDGSPESSTALTWAAQEARLRGARLRVVRAWDLPVAADYGAYLPSRAFEDLPADVARELDEQLTEVLGESPDVPVERVVVEGPAAKVLLEAGAGTDLLVVGSRGRGGFAGLLLGSVGNQLAHHSHVPVTIVRT